MWTKSVYLQSFLLCLFLQLSGSAFSQNIPTPKEHFGFSIGDDYQLANFTQTEAYFKKLAASSERMELTIIGQTEEGRNQYMFIVSSPENLKKLARYKEISQKLARAENLSEAEARALAQEGKAIVWIDGGLHATETVGIHQLIETAYHLASRKDPETQNILDNVIILLTHANPDGQELVSNWYMREADPKKRSLEFLPRLYQKYIGHDNNRDFYIMNMQESRNMGNQLFIEWIPQIMYNHHQRGPAGSVLAGPPYRDPFNYVFDPLMITGIDALGAAMYNRLNAEDKPGFTRLTGSTFSTWYNGGLRTTTHFHNMIGLLTEIIGNPTPDTIPLVPQRLIPNNNTPNPVLPQPWHFRQSIDYSLSLNWAVLDYAARHHDQLLYNIYHMGRNSIERGSHDYWTPFPSRIDAITDAIRSGRKEGQNAQNPPLSYYDAVLKDPKLRDPRGYIIPADQDDFPTATKFVNALIRTGIQVHRATDAFTVAAKTYPAGSYIVKSAQAFRPHILDMFEPQDYPNDFQYPGGPPVRPYDAAGWTLAFQMGVQFDRILDSFDGPFQVIPYGKIQQPEGSMTTARAGSGYQLSAGTNDSFIAVNDLLAAGIEVNRLSSPGPDQGDFFVPVSSKASALLEKSSRDLGLRVETVAKKPATSTLSAVKPRRIALWDSYGGSMPSGWVRWLMEQYHFPIQQVFAKEIDAGELRKKYDVILFVTRAIPGVSSQSGGRGYTRREPKEAEIPAEYHAAMGSLSAGKSIPQLKKFLEEGGTVVTIGSSANLAFQLGLPVRDALVEMTSAGKEQPLPGEKYYIPGSILQVEIDTNQRATWGMHSRTDVYFDDSPVFTIAPDALAKGTIKPLAWFPTSKPLRSGWAWGQAYLMGGIAAFEASVGKGKLLVYGPEITFRAQSHGTFKLVFNQLYSTAD